MGPELKNVAQASDGDSVGLGREGTVFDGLVRFAEDDLVDLVGGEAGHLDRSVVEDQFLELELELVEVPLALFAEPIDDEAQHALLVLGQVADLNTGDAIEPVKLRRLETRPAVDDEVVLADEDRIAKAERADHAGDLAHVSRVLLTGLA